MITLTIEFESFEKVKSYIDFVTPFFYGVPIVKTSVIPTLKDKKKELGKPAKSKAKKDIKAKPVQKDPIIIKAVPRHPVIPSVDILPKQDIKVYQVESLVIPVETLPVNEMKPCEICGTPFKPLSIRSKFCSKQCVNIYQRGKNGEDIDQILSRLKKEYPIIETKRPENYRELL